MKTLLTSAMIAVAVLSAWMSQPLAAQQPSKVAVCSLLPREEVKKHIPWQNFLDAMPLEEEAIGTNGSSCNYPTVHVQVLPFTQSFLDSMRKAGANESISGIGDEAYFRNNKNLFAEIVVKVGPRLLTLQADIDDGKVDAVKPGVLSLARAYVGKLR